MPGLLNVLGRVVLFTLGIAGIALTQVISLPVIETVALIVFGLVCLIVALLPGRLRVGWVLEAIDLI